MSEHYIVGGSRTSSPDVVLTSEQEHSVDPLVAVEAALMIEPDFYANQPPAIIGHVYRWVLNLVNLLFQYARHYFGAHSDRVQALERRIRVLEARPVPNQAAQSTPLPRQPQQPSSSKSTRCQRCHVIGHGMSDCRTKDPIGTKKRVAANQKMKKQMQRQRTLPIPLRPPYPHSHHGVTFDDYFPDTFAARPAPPPPVRTGVTTRSMSALVADASEFRRRKTQSVRDKRRKGATSSGTS
jgi:hypothetical protein